MVQRAGRGWIVAIVATALVMGGTTAWFLLKARQTDDLDALYAKAKAAGFPTTSEEVQPRPAGRPEDNGASPCLPPSKKRGVNSDFGTKTA